MTETHDKRGSSKGHYLHIWRKSYNGCSTETSDVAETHATGRTLKATTYAFGRKKLRAAARRQVTWRRDTSYTEATIHIYNGDKSDRESFPSTNVSIQYSLLTPSFYSI
jgi:hypothetical protein